MNEKTLFLLAAALALGSCLLLPRTRLEVVLYEAIDPRVSWAPGSIKVERATMETEIARLAAEALLPLAHRCALPLSDPGEPDGLRLDIDIVEREFTRGLDTLNSISYTASLRDGRSGRLLAQTIYCEESQETIASSYRLYAISEKVLKSLAVKLSKQPKGGS